MVNMSELKVYRDPKDGLAYREFYEKSEVDKVIESITKGAMSMFRESNRCRGLDTKSPLGRIADVAFKHWMYVERLEARITEKDNEIAELKEIIENYRFDNKNMLHKIMKQDAELQHQKYKRCLGIAAVCFEKSYSTTLVKYDKESGLLRNFYDWWGKRWLALAEEPTWAKFLQLIHKETK